MRLLLAVLAALLLVAAPARAAEWLAGDLHVHTCYSHDVWCGPDDDNTGPEDFYTFGHSVADDFTLASLRGLDYLAITDHNDIRSQSDPGFGSSGVIGIPAYENSLKGHNQMLGARRLYDNGDQGAKAVAKLSKELHHDGGVFQANHPSDPVWGYGFDVPLDAIEVWNLPRFYQSPFPSNSDNDEATALWHRWLDHGEHVAATGGSDSHWRITDSAQGPGNPTTWVYAEKGSAQGVLDGIRAGRTFITWQPPAFQPPRLFLETASGGMVGDTVPANSAFRVRVEGAPGATVRVLADGGKVIDSATVDAPSFTHTFTVPKGTTWVAAELYGDDQQELRQQTCEPVIGSQTTYCRNRIALLAMTSALYVK
jgi:hypothetical protein